MKDATAKIAAQVPVDVATFLLNEKRQDITGVEERQDVRVLLIPNQNLETPHYEVERVREQESARIAQESYELVADVENPAVDYRQLESPSTEEAVVKEIERTVPKPTPKSRRTDEPGLLRRWLRAMVGNGETKTSPKSENAPRPSQRRRAPPNNRRRGNRNAKTAQVRTRAQNRTNGAPLIRTTTVIGAPRKVINRKTVPVIRVAIAQLAPRRRTGPRSVAIIGPVTTRRRSTRQKRSPGIKKTSPIRRHSCHLAIRPARVYCRKNEDQHRSTQARSPSRRQWKAKRRKPGLAIANTKSLNGLPT